MRAIWKGRVNFGMAEERVRRMAPDLYNHHDAAERIRGEWPRSVIIFTESRRLGETSYGDKRTATAISQFRYAVKALRVEVW
jgi:hypothetical protein